MQTKPVINLIFIGTFLLGSHVAFADYINDGYMNRISYNPGDTTTVFINANANFSNAKLYLFNENNLIVDSVIANLTPQSISPSNTAPWENGFGYAASFTYVVPLNLISGIYNWENKIYFISKSSTKDADLTIVYPSNMEAAYNNAGGKSLYSNGSTNNVRSFAVSFLRPLTPVELTGYRQFSDPFMRWITALGTYNFQVICDQDMDDYSEIQNSRMVVVIGHSEYWSRAARLNFDQFVDSGKNAAILSGNTMWWQVRYSADKTKLICYKDNYADTCTNPLLKTINWTMASLNYPCLNSIGVDYAHGAYPPSNLQTYQGPTGFKITNPGSPLLAGTALHIHDTLSCMTREYDGALLFGLNAAGDPSIDTLSLGFCKMELIGYDVAQNPVYGNVVNGYGTFIAFKKNSSSGNIINTASSNWCSNTGAGYDGGFGGPDSVRIKIITSNILDLLLSNSNIYSSPNNCSLTTMLQSNTTSTLFSIFPNPTNGKLIIRSSGNLADAPGIELFNSMGALVLTKQFEGTEEETLDISDFPDGAYFYLYRSGNTISQSGTIVLSH